MAASRFQTLSAVNIYILFIFSFISWAAESHAFENDLQYYNCSLPFSCGSLSTRNITYPFWGNGRPSYCGLKDFELGCQDDEYAFLDFNEQRYRVLEIDQTNHVITVTRNDLWNNLCLQDQARNTTMDNSNVFNYPTGIKEISIFYCSNPSPNLSRLLGGIPCPLEGYSNRTALFVEDEVTFFRLADYPELSNCNIKIKVPVLQSSLEDLTNGRTDWKGVLDRGFKLAYEVDNSCSRCESSGGICGTNPYSPQYFSCFCSNQPFSDVCPDHGQYKYSIVAVGSVGGGILLFVSLILCVDQSRIVVLLKGQKNDQGIENFIKQHGSLAPKRFSYSQVKGITESFCRKLGQGGFGAVYSGKLPDGTLVAVKLLNASKGNGEEFINEVASISKTSHVNIVTLLGFCYEGNKRALIYEFMSNGSLDKFLHGENNLRNGTGSAWGKLYQIAVGIARGLEYLHRGCRTRILHFDIKPQNILLDDNLCPKISDFGMSKLCLERESIVSMLVARGTVGYIAPEVFCKNFGEVSHKSDVYSYGMMLLEMVGGRDRNLNEADRSSEVYFHDQVYQLIEDGYDQGLYSQLMEVDRQTARKMALVGIWCIQTDPKQRPSMGSVLEMLEGIIEALPTPPKPFLFSPPRSQIDPLSISVSI